MTNIKKHNRIKILFKKYLITGLTVIIPIWITFSIINIILKWVSDFTFPILNHLLSNGYYLIRILSFLVSITIIVLTGYIVNLVVVKKLLDRIEIIFKKFPVLGIIHPAIKKLMNFLFNNENIKNFKKVVFVNYPNKSTYSIAFLTGEQIINGEKYLCTFMPTTPNPTTGFLLMFKENEVIYTNYTVEQAFEIIISVGVINNNNV
ncbi:MAG: DUF502 domain-containing protein [Endomicrobium sp.]|jgi:uncharacterized membrane protein|nr:DUF502 domain-containing protein [Endomicrobium sp.]